ncbi:MAG: helix-hairpin-helix domain-containing protein [Nitrospirae bacterium]|nr:helix-hairpin-helix domain-containing protein [Nitrospirota bacterium]
MRRGILVLSIVIFLLPFTISNNNISAQTKKDINSATVADLMEIKGIGRKRAVKIVRFIKKRGGVESIDDLLEIKGIGRGLLKKIREVFEVKDSVSPDH